MADLIGQRLGQYEIVALLGEGGMAAVYRARQPSMDRDVAVKVIESKLARNPEFVKRFEREARTVAALSHPFVLKVFDYGQQGDLVYLVMELLTGGSLAELIRREPLSPDRTSQVLDQVASALDYAHRQGIIHRDLKPQNVLLDGEGNAHLTDFGIVKLLSETTALTQSGLAMGTPTYMAPEQWQGKAVDARADLYSLGVMLFEMLTGRLPFVADTPFGLMHQHVYDPPPSIRDWRKNLPPGVEQVLNQALAKDPDQRFQTAHDMAAALKAALAGMTLVPTTPVAETERPSASTSVPVPHVASTAIELPVAPKKRRTWLPVAALAVVVLLVGALLVILNRGSGQVSATPRTTITQTNAVAAVPSTSPTTPALAQPSATSISAAPAASATQTPNAKSTETPAPPTQPVPTATHTHELSSTEVEQTIQAAMNLSLTEQAQGTATAAKALQAAATMTATLWTSTPTPNLRATANARLTATQVAVNQLATANAQSSATQDSRNQTATATLWTSTPTPTYTPTLTPTFTATPVATPAPGANRMDEKGVSQVWVPAGCFQMGSDPAKDGYAQNDEQPQHEVCLRQGYWIDTYEVTNEAYQKFIDDGGYSNPNYWSDEGWQWVQSNKGPENDDGFTGPKQPRVGVSWYEADAYARWRGGRLSTEAEWEYAARGPQSLLYPWGNTYDSSMLNAEGKVGKTTDVGTYPAGKSWVGAYDMAGNVWEWVNDWYSDSYYAQKMKDDPPGPTSGQSRAVRGGSFSFLDGPARAAYRSKYDPVSRDHLVGFRVVTGQGTALAPGAARTDEKGVAQVWVPAGCFQMGSDPAKDKSAGSDEQPQHEVCLTQGYWLDTYEVTNAAYQKFIDDGGYTKQQYWSADGWQWTQSNKGPQDYGSSFNGPQQPRVGITWYEADAYARWRGGRLPTEAEWEYAARGPQSLIYPWGNTYDRSKLNAEDKVGRTTTIVRYPTGTSWVGVSDMAGNVWEWVNDLYGDKYYGEMVKDDPSGPSTGKSHVMRGGSWASVQDDVRAASRSGGLPAVGGNGLGFRVVRMEANPTHSTNATQQTATPLPAIAANPTATPITRLSATATLVPFIPTTTPIPNRDLISTTNFENGQLRGWDVGPGSYKTVDTASGNHVLQVGKHAYSKFYLPSGLTDYAFEVRFMKVSKGESVMFLWIRVKIGYPSHSCDDGYSVHVENSRISLTQDSSSCGESVTMAADPINLMTDTWYTLRLEGKGSELRAYLNGQLILAGHSDALKSNIIAFGTYSDDNLELYDFDDIRVWALH